jgi:hypothetical protein
MISCDQVQQIAYVVRRGEVGTAVARQKCNPRRVASDGQVVEVVRTKNSFVLDTPDLSSAVQLPVTGHINARGKRKSVFPPSQVVEFEPDRILAREAPHLA